MPSKRETLSPAGTTTGKDLGFTHQELIREWADLYAEIPPMIAADEKTKSDIAKECGVDQKTIARFIDEWLKSGKLVEVGMRRTPHGPTTMVYKLAT